MIKTIPVHLYACMTAVLISSLACAEEAALPLIDDPVYTQPSRMVEVEPGRRLNLYCVGEGSPTVVFEAGQGSSLMMWGRVQPAVARKMRACSYDRAGIGFSDGINRAATSANIVDDLHRLLVAADVKPPYVLVGHSLGGMFVRLYADRYPAEVAGMVLVDPAVEDQAESFRKLDLRHRSVEQWRADTMEPELVQDRQCVAGAKPKLVRGSELFKLCVEEPYAELGAAVNTALQDNEATLKFQEANLSETEYEFSASADQVRASRHAYGDLPLAVLTRGKWAPAKESATPEELAKHEAVIATWMRLHDKVAKLSTRGSNTVVPGARHTIMIDKPQAVVDAIDQVVQASRK